MDLCHGVAGLLHRVQRLLVDVGSLDRIDLLLELRDLRLRRLEVLLVELLPSESGLGDCKRSYQVSSVVDTNQLNLALSDQRERTILVCCDVLPRYRLLLIHLILQTLFPLLQHVQLLPQLQDGVLGRIFPLLRGRATEPRPHRGTP